MDQKIYEANASLHKIKGIYDTRIKSPSLLPVT
jgi:hypothetical protein